MEGKYPKANRRLIAPDTLQRLSRHNPWRWGGAVALEWALIGVTLTVCLTWPAWWIWLPGAIFIGLRQHAIGILGHEGSHYLITRSRPLNDRLANWLTLYPLLITVQGYRESHLKHHWYLETPDDPSRASLEEHPEDWKFPMRKSRLLAILMRDLTGLSQKSSAGLLKYLWDIPDKGRHMANIAVMQGVAIAAAVAGGHGWAYPLLWLAPLFTVAVACYRVRAVAEHSGFGDASLRYKRRVIDPLVNTRTSVHHPVLDWLFAPYNVSCHIEHHLFPSVPAFNLREAHHAIGGSDEYRRHAHITRGYTGLFAELTEVEA